MQKDKLRFERTNACAECMRFKATCGKGTACSVIRQPLRNYNGIRFTSDGFDCALPVSIDSHTVCSYGCLYCFSDNLAQHRDNAAKKVGQTKLNKIEGIFSGKDKSKDAQLIRKALKYDKLKNGYPCPVQLGAICDPLDNIERNQGWFLKFIEIAKKYNQPVRISTKGNLFLTDEYINALREKPHLFRVHFSIISPDDKLIKQIDKRAPPTSERIESMRRLESIGVETCLRFRPIIPGLSDATPDYPNAWKTLIDMAHKAGCRNISYEVGFVPGHMTGDLLKRWKEIEKITKVPILQIYKRFGKTQACIRPHYKWTETIMHNIHDYCKSLGWNIGVSDPVWKQLSECGSCCAIPENHKVFGNWQTENATNQLMLARDKGKLISAKDITPEWAYKTKSDKLYHPGVGPTVRYKRKHETWADKLFNVWTDLTRERGPLQYFQGALLPFKKLTNGDILFKYIGLKRSYPKQTPYWKIKPWKKKSKNK